VSTDKSVCATGPRTDLKVGHYNGKNGPPGKTIWARNGAPWQTEHIGKTSWTAPHRVIYTTPRLEFLPNRLVIPSASGPQGPRASAASRSRDLPRYGDITPARSVQAGGIA